LERLEEPLEDQGKNHVETVIWQHSPYLGQTRHDPIKAIRQVLQPHWTAATHGTLQSTKGRNFGYGLVEKQVQGPQYCRLSHKSPQKKELTSNQTLAMTGTVACCAVESVP
jgi:hypothetical protein